MTRSDPTHIKAAIAALKEAKSPLIVVGKGAAYAVNLISSVLSVSPFSYVVSLLI